MWRLICWLFSWNPCKNGSPNWLCNGETKWCRTCRTEAFKRLVEG